MYNTFASRRVNQNFPVRQRLNILDDHRLCWKIAEFSGCLEPVWPREPDINAVRNLALAHLLTKDHSTVQVSFFADGSFHRLFLIETRDGIGTTQYIMRVAMPVDPFFKTESEVATMDYVRRYSSIPVPRVVAYDSNSSNELGYEWILMERINGSPLRKVWYDMPFEAKVDLTVNLAWSLKELWAHPLPLFGNVYYADVWNRVGCIPNPTTSAPQSLHHASPFKIDDTFVVGRVVCLQFLMGKRLLLRTNRGPYGTAKDLAQSEIELLKQRVRNLSPSPGTDYYSAVDKDLANNEAKVRQVVDSLPQVVPQIYSNSDGPEDAKMLWHYDMSLDNLLVDPTTYRLTGFVDWACVSVVPAWATLGGIPEFLTGVEVTEPPPVKSVSAQEGAGSFEIRRNWELGLLRHKFTEIVGELFGTREGSTERVKLKRDLCDHVDKFEETWEMTQYWLKKHFDIGEMPDAVKYDEQTQ